MLRLFFRLPPKRNINDLNIEASALYDIILNLISVETTFQKINTEREREKKTAIKWNPSWAWPKSLYLQTNSFALISIAISFKMMMNIILSCSLHIQFGFKIFWCSLIYSQAATFAYFNRCSVRLCTWQQQKPLNNNKKLLLLLPLCREKHVPSFFTFKRLKTLIVWWAQQ